MNKKSDNISFHPHLPKILIVGPVIVMLLFMFLFKVEQTGRTATNPQPNIILIMTDDLDLKLGSVTRTYAPNLYNLIADHGATFNNFITNQPLCCPSRATFLRGQFNQNTGIFNNSPPQGGFETFYASGKENSTVATWLQGTGYKTVLLGKYLNGYPNTAPSTYIPPGWNEWYSAEGYYNYTMNENGKLVSYGQSTSDYLTDVIARKSADFITRTSTSGQPFFMYVAPSAPHQPITPAERHKTLYPGVQVPRTPAFNETDVSDKPLAVSSLPLLTSDQILKLDKVYRQRLQTLRAVDDMILTIVNALQASGQLNNTYIVFTSDNGFHEGQHRLDYGKGTNYIEDTILPLFVSGPGVSSGLVVNDLISNADIAPTFAELANISPPTFVDGRSFAGLISANYTQPQSWRTGLLISFRPTAPIVSISSPRIAFEEANPDVMSASSLSGGGGLGEYQGIQTDRYVYMEYLDTGEKEFYDLLLDPYQLTNTYASADPLILNNLKNMLAAFNGCSADSCRVADAMSIIGVSSPTNTPTPTLAAGDTPTPTSAPPTNTPTPTVTSALPTCSLNPNPVKIGQILYVTGANFATNSIYKCKFEFGGGSSTGAFKAGCNSTQTTTYTTGSSGTKTVRISRIETNEAATCPTLTVNK